MEAPGEAQDPENPSSPPPSPTRITITRLSKELLLAILQARCIKRRDLVALRLACVVLNDVATAVLFRRIHLSPLRRDRDAFLAICKSPHLARCVHELEWQELSFFPGSFRKVIQGDFWQQSLVKWDDDVPEMCEKIEASVPDLFWLPKSPPAAGQEAHLEARRQEAIAHFYTEFLEALSKLPYLHSFISRPMPVSRVLDCSGYPLKVRFLRYHYPSVKRINPPLPAPQSNDGLFHFLLPAIQSLSVPSITRLFWEDEFLEASHLCPLIPGAFERLDALSITLVPGHCRDYTNLALNLAAATNVRQLSLNLNYLPEPKRSFANGFRLYPFCQSKANPRPHWPKLRSLSLGSVPFQPKSLFSILKDHTSTLRHLFLYKCGLRLSDAKELANIPNLSLDSLSFSEWTTTLKMVVAQDVLGYFSQYTDQNGPGDSALIIQTETAAKEAVAFTTPLEPLVEYQWEDGNDEDDEDDDDDERQSLASYASSEDSIDHRTRVAPKWMWGRYFHEKSYGEVFYYQVPQSHPHGHPTKLWKFTHRDGTFGIGPHPWAWFEDWDPDSGDVEEPTPYCDELSTFYGLPPQNMRLFLGSLSPAWNFLNQLRPPDGAIAYGHAEDADYEYASENNYGEGL